MLSAPLWLAETVLCWQSDPLYFNRDFPKQFIRPMPKAREATATLCSKTSALFMANPGEHVIGPPIQITENVVALTRHVLGPKFKAQLRTWLTAVIRRLDTLAANPYQDFRSKSDFDSDVEWLEYKRRNMGPPLPIEVADPSREIAPADLAPLYANFIASVDWAANPYLRSPDELRQAGFVGEPYRHG